MITNIKKLIPNEGIQNHFIYDKLSDKHICSTLIDAVPSYMLSYLIKYTNEPISIITINIDNAAGEDALEKEFKRELSNIKTCINFENILVVTSAYLVSNKNKTEVKKSILETLGFKDVTIAIPGDAYDSYIQKIELMVYGNNEGKKCIEHFKNNK